MCMFCGGQCGGVGDFIISTILPFLAVLFVNLKHLYKKIINKKSNHSDSKKQYAKFN